MSDEKISREFLGEQMVRMRADIRDVRAEQGRLKSEQISMRADLSGVQTELVGVKTELAGLQTGLADLRVEVKGIDRKIDNLAASVDARFDQVHETMATNLNIVLKAIDGKRG
ncbi:MAG: hypothetical protein ACRED5_05005 [Propylenella sp.]